MSYIPSKLFRERIRIVESGASGDYELNGPIAASTNIDLPPDSQSMSGTPALYIVGKKQLQVDLNGMIQEEGADYFEVGTPGDFSHTIYFTFEIIPDAKLGFRIFGA